MMKISVISCSILLTVAMPLNSFAWGKTGHGIVARIAFTMLDSNTRASVQDYLGPTTIEEASVWMDDVRSDRRYDYMKPWHYVNITRGSQYEETKEDNIVNALNNAITELEHKDKLDRLQIKKDIMVIFHLTGDMHMPLHVGYATDKGGNDITVKYLNTTSNLHRVWDSEIIESEQITTRECLVLYSRFDESQISGFKQINIVNWINEPRSLLGNVYNYNGSIDQDYITSNSLIVKQQLLIAGIRLAAVLEHLFKA